MMYGSMSRSMCAMVDYCWPMCWGSEMNGVMSGTMCCGNNVGSMSWSMGCGNNMGRMSRSMGCGNNMGSMSWSMCRDKMGVRHTISGFWNMMDNWLRHSISYFRFMVGNGG